MTTPISKTVAGALAAMAIVGMAPSPASQRPQAPAQQAPVNEVERVSRLSGVPARRWRKAWDGKNRAPGERAHRRWRKLRSSGRR